MLRKKAEQDAFGFLFNSREKRDFFPKLYLFFFDSEPESFKTKFLIKFSNGCLVSPTSPITSTKISRPNRVATVKSNDPHKFENE